MLAFLQLVRSTSEQEGLEGMKFPEKADRPGYAPRPEWVKWLVIAGSVAVLGGALALLSGASTDRGRHLSGATHAGGGAVEVVAAVRV